MSATSISTAPFSAYERMLASRYLRARRKEGFVSVIAGFSFLGIMLGVATLIIVMSVLNGFRNQLYDKIFGLNGHAVVQPFTGSPPFTNFADVAGKFSSIPGILKVVPMIEGQVMLSSATQARGGLVWGLSEASIAKLPLISRNVVAGTFEGFEGQRGIAVGSRLAADHGVGVGDFITLISPRGARTPFGVAPRSRPYKIAAVFELGMTDYDRSMVVMPLPEAQSYFNKRQRVDVLEVVVDDPEKVEQRIKAMQAANLGPFLFTSWRQRNRAFFEVLEVERIAMFIVLSMIILVAALNIISGIMMLVKDKGRDIAILRTMGATRGGIMRVFLMTGMSIGVFGTIAGVIIGVVFCRNIEWIRQTLQYWTGRTLMDPNVYHLTQMRADIDLYDTLSIVCFAVGLTLLATIYPAWRASTLDPVEALRYE